MVDLEPPSVAPAPQGESSSHTAAWLRNEYDADVWIVEADDSNARLDPARIDFRYMLPNGELLTAAPNWHWLATVKSYAWQIRQDAKITVAKRHETMVRNLMHLAAWTILRGRHSFSALLPSDIVDLKREAAFGATFLLRYRERMETHLAWRRAEGIPLPSYIDRDGYRMLDQRKLCAEAHLGYKAARFCGSLVYDAALASGIKPASPTAPTPIPKEVRNWVMIADLLAPLQQLYDDDFDGPVDRPCFSPFPEGCAKAAKSVGRSVGRTKTPPAKQYMFLLDRSLRWVTEYGPHLLDALDAFRSGSDYIPPPALDGALGSPWPLAQSRLERSPRIDLETAVTYLTLACFVVIGAFTARRKTEILQLRRGCFRGDRQSGFWLRSYIAKTLRQEDETPCPECVGHAIHLLERLSDGDLLFRWRSPFNAERTLDPGKVLKRFGDFIDLPPLEGGKYWKFAPHQLRRMFAMLYVWRWQLGDLESLSHHLRHFDLRMTIRYLTTDDLVLLDEEQKRLTYHVMTSVAEGGRSVGGKGGVRLNQIIARLRKTLKVHLPDRLPALIERFVDRSRVLVKTNPWSYCVCPDTREGAERANCRKAATQTEGSGPALAEAKPETCMGCTFNMTDVQFAPFIEREIAHAEKLLLADPPQLLRQATERRLSSLRVYRTEILAAESA